MGNGIRKTGVVVTALGFSMNASAGNVSYFDSSINYWGKTSKEVVKNPETLEASKKSITETSPKESKTDSFKWETYLNPNNKEFFREGDYTPPEPFMELVRNPTDENIRMWFAYMEQKNELSTRLSKRMEEFAAKNTATLPREAKLSAHKIAVRQPLADDEFERYRFRMYFDSQCPHCHQMFETLNDLQDRGYFVEARQVDRGSIAGIKSNVAVVQASTTEVQKFHVTAVPLLLIGDLKNKKVYRQSGFMTSDEVIAAIHHN